jgi:uncharacterized protein (DUF1778 family)
MKRIGLYLRFRNEKELSMIRRAAKRDSRSMNYFVLESAIAAAAQTLKQTARTKEARAES